jgi:hypothetical protein
LRERERERERESKSRTLPCQQIADPFLAFLRRVLWKDKSPSLGEGILATLWTLLHAIDTNPGGVADPIQLIILRREAKQYEARELSDSELGEHKQAVKELEVHLARQWERFKEPPAEGEAVTVPMPEG